MKGVKEEEEGIREDSKINKHTRSHDIERSRGEGRERE